ncbi:hypothetical protein O6H91_21G041900 [Diphasiastrum complanatum]|nr:hypothetical protein O6H91_21G041900 [Diphasiastrum complanatum]
MLTMQRDLLRKRRMKVKEMNPSQYTFLMRQWVQKSGAEVGRPMLEQMIKMGVDPIEVYTIMIKQSIEQAKACSTTEVFEDQGGSEKHVMKALNHLHVMRLKGLTPRSDTYAPIVSWLAESDLLAEIQELLKWIKQDNADACFIDMFKCLGEGGQQDKIKRCFLLLKDFGVNASQLSEYLTGLVHGITRGSKFDDTVNIFRELVESFKLEPTLEAYKALIKYSCQQGEIYRGLDFIKEMSQKGLELAPEIFNPFLLRLVHEKLPTGAFDLFTSMLKMGVQPSVDTYNFLIRACMKANNLEKIFTLLAEMKHSGMEPTTVTYNAVIHAFGSLKRLDSALHVLNEMESDNLMPDADTYKELINACSSQKDCEKALQLFDDMQIRGIKPSEGVYCALVNAIIKSGNLEQAVKIMKKAEKNGTNIGVSTKSTILAGLANDCRLHEAYALLEDIQNGGKMPEPFAYGHLLAAVGRSGDLDGMFKLFEVSKVAWPKRKEEQVKEQQNHWCMSIVESCILHGELRRLVQFLEQVKEEELVIDQNIFFDKIFLHIANGGADTTTMVPEKWGDGFAMLDAMRSLGFHPSRMCLEVLLDCCATMKDSKRAQLVIAEMEKEQIEPNILTMIRLFRVFVAVGEFQRAYFMLGEMNQNDLKDSDIKMLVKAVLDSNSGSAAYSTFYHRILKFLEAL